ncbi:hypothetical protein GGX14DRAFT_408709 [Mycena pura]|uniref:Uncharacterized protein n=1 Tax=Mycena pura TaxID=153505 RepID=A0AAD6UPL2_9AGAR|nr:hypothetical protein GGX14DRAFT_408709 [Mycena pura]
MFFINSLLTAVSAATIMGRANAFEGTHHAAATLAEFNVGYVNCPCPPFNGPSAAYIPSTLVGSHQCCQGPEITITSFGSTEGEVEKILVSAANLNTKYTRLRLFDDAYVSAADTPMCFWCGGHAVHKVTFLMTLMFQTLLCASEQLSPGELVHGVAATLYHSQSCVAMTWIRAMT